MIVEIGHDALTLIPAEQSIGCLTKIKAMRPIGL